MTLTPVVLEQVLTPYGFLWKVTVDNKKVEWYSKKELAVQAASRHRMKRLEGF